MFPPHRFSKDNLRCARIINQVDCKFIACLLGDQVDLDTETLGEPQADSKYGGLTLVLIDQHAADERIRVEQFLQELCVGYLRNRSGREDSTLETRKLSPPLPVLLTEYEARKLTTSTDIQAAFSHWGFHFADLASVGSLKGRCDSRTESETDLLYVQVLVEQVPEVVGDKVWRIRLMRF